MPFFKKRGLKKRAHKKKSVRGGRKSSSVSSAVKTYVKRTIHSQIENKGVQVQVATLFGNVVQSPTMNIYPLTPYAGAINIVQGVGSANRTGNQVKPIKVMLKYVIYPTGYNAGYNPNPEPCEVMMYLGYVKSAPGFLPTATDIANLYQYNNFVSIPLGSIMDLNQQVNKDYWTIKKAWTHKIGYSNSGGTGINAAYQSYSNNDFKLNVVRKLDITKLYPKTLKFNDTSAQQQGPGLFLFYQAVGSSGRTFTASVTPIAIQMELDIDF